MMSKKLLIESLVVSPLSLTLQESKRGVSYLKESVAKSKTPSYVVLKEEFDSNGVMTAPLRVILAATILDEENENGRTYRASIMECALLNESCKSAMAERQLTCTVDGHPEDVYVEPGNASHLCTNAWIEGNVLMNEWEVLNTSKGKDLRALIEGKVKFGVSIRGLGSQDSYGNILDDYEYLGTDCVGNPSARLFVTPTVKESVVMGKSISSGVNVMKFSTAGEARTYLSEQSVLLANDKDQLSKATRILNVERVINESGLPPTDLAKLIPEVESMKSSLAGVTESKVQAKTNSKESILLTENSRLTAKCRELESRLATDKTKELRLELAKARAKLAKTNLTESTSSPKLTELARCLKAERAKSNILGSIVQAMSTTPKTKPAMAKKKAESSARKISRPARFYKLECTTKFLFEGEEEGSETVTWDVTNNLEPEDKDETPVATISSDDSSVIYIYAPDESEPYKLVDTENGIYVATSSVVDLVDQAVDKIDPEYLLSSDELETHLDLDGGLEGGEEMDDEMGGEDDSEDSTEEEPEDEGKGSAKESRRFGRNFRKQTPRKESKAAVATIRGKQTKKSVTEQSEFDRQRELHGIPSGDFI